MGALMGWYMNQFFIIKSILLLVMLGLALGQDIREKKIKNWVTFPAALAGIIINFWEAGPGGLAFALQGWLVPVLSLLLLYRMNVMGAGDIKLFAAIGALLGLKFTACCFIFSVFAGGAIAFVILAKDRALAARMKKMCAYLGFMAASGRIIPYSARGDGSSKFIFSAAIVPGTIMQLLITLFQLKGVNINVGGVLWF